MAAPAARDILYLPGRLVASPTSLTAAYPHGGTELGEVRNVTWRPAISYDKAVSEEWGVTVAAFVEEERALLACVLRSWDNDMLARLFHSVQTSSYGDVGVLGRVTGSKRSGYDIAERSFPLLFSPRAGSSGRMLLVRNAMPLLDETAELQLSLGREFGVAAVFEAIPDSQGRLYDFDFAENITL